jgi:hypothetical protein
MGTAEDLASGLHSVPDHVAFTMCAPWRKGMNSTFETIECHGIAALTDAECLVIVVSANIAPSHSYPPWGNRSFEPNGPLAIKFHDQPGWDRGGYEARSIIVAEVDRRS